MRSSMRSPGAGLFRITLIVALVLAATPVLFSGMAQAQDIDESRLKQDVLASMEAAGTYRLLRYDVLDDERQLDIVAEVNLSQGTKSVAFADGAVSYDAVGSEASKVAALARDEREPSRLADGALRFYQTAGDGWVLDGRGDHDGETAYFLRQKVPVTLADREAQDIVLVIDQETMLPVAYRESGADQSGPYAYETVYIDYGDPIAVPVRVAVPATPIAGGCGSEFSSPTEIAEVFVAAATADDLGAALLCFAPDRQPAGWEDVFLGGQSHGPDDISDCRRTPYRVSNLKLNPELSAIIFNFETDCIVATLDDAQRSLYDSDTLEVDTLVVQVHRAGNRWYVQDAFALVPD